MACGSSAAPVQHAEGLLGHCALLQVWVLDDYKLCRLPRQARHSTLFVLQALKLLGYFPSRKPF